MGYRSRITAVFTWRMSTQTRISPLDFDTTTKGETQGVGPRTFSIISGLSSSSSLAETCLRTWKGIRRGGLSDRFDVGVDGNFLLVIGEFSYAVKDAGILLAKGLERYCTIDG